MGSDKEKEQNFRPNCNVTYFIRTILEERFRNIHTLNKIEGNLAN